MTQDSREFQIDLVNLVESGQIPGKTLAQIDPASAIPAGIGVAKPRKTSASAVSSSTGIASPITEDRDGDGEATTRTHYPPISLISSDGFIVMNVEHVHEVHCKDANGAEVVFDYAKPVL